MSSSDGIGPREVARFDADKERQPHRWEAVRAVNVELNGFPIGTRVRITGAHHGRWVGRTGVVCKIPVLVRFDYRYVALERSKRERTDHTELFPCADLEVIPLGEP